MLEIVEIIRPAEQGRTTPFLCKASDGRMYFVKGYAASISGLIKEWLGAHLAKEFGLPVPAFQLAEIHPDLVAYYGGKAVSELKSGCVFASESVASATELKFETTKMISPQLKASILFFDLWVENEDRTLTEKGGNPNLLWKSDSSELFVIDHNLIFDSAFDKAKFWKSHVFSDALKHQDDLIERMDYENKMQKALACWRTAWDKMPEEWVELNEEVQGFDPVKHLQRLDEEANGDIWLKLP